MGGPLPKPLRTLAYTTRYVLNGYPSVYLPITRLKHRGKTDWAASRDTELVIEAFGRSGSTFAVIAFEFAQRRPVKLAHHTHAAAQVIASVRMGIPTVVIVRRPADVVLSHMVRRGVSAKAALKSWIRFHRRILPCRTGVVIVPFEAMTRDMGAVIRRINEKFGTQFAEFEHNAENEASVLRLIEERNLQKFGRPTEFVARPTADREAAKLRLRAEYEAPALARLRAEADQLYGDLLAEVESSAGR